jgi:hypothetical protein
VRRRIGHRGPYPYNVEVQMALERWGSLSVRDHNDIEALTANILLYDRLIVPVPEGDEERARWAAMEWNPDLLSRRIDQLGGMAVQKPWNAEREERYRNKLRELHDLNYDTKFVTLPYQVSRMILAQEPVTLPEGVTHVETVLAYNSEAEIRRDFILQRTADPASQLGLLFGQKLAIPAGADAEDTFLRAMELSRDEEFRSNRRALYEWQHRVLERGYSPAHALEEMEQLISAYNGCVQRANRTVRFKLAFVVATTAVAVADTFIGSSLALASGLLATVQFATLERKPVVEPGESRPAAAFHDMMSIVEWRT